MKRKILKSEVNAILTDEKIMSRLQEEKNHLKNLIETEVNTSRGRAKTHKIEWTEKTWNPSAGCTKVSSGCKNCYAETMAKRLQGSGVVGYENGFKFNTVPSRLNDPLKRKKPTVYFVNSMSDIFHEDMPEDYLDRIFDVIKNTPQHTYQILTKRADRMLQYLSVRAIPKNIWLGVSVENRKEGLPRIDKLRNLKASVLFLSVEPLLEDLGKRQEAIKKETEWLFLIPY